MKVSFVIVNYNRREELLFRFTFVQYILCFFYRIKSMELYIILLSVQTQNL